MFWKKSSDFHWIRTPEREGWRAGDLPYPILDLRNIIEIDDTIKLRRSSQDFTEYFDSILYNYTLEGINDEFEKSAISLTRDVMGKLRELNPE